MSCSEVDASTITVCFGLEGRAKVWYLSVERVAKAPSFQAFVISPNPATSDSGLLVADINVPVTSSSISYHHPKHYAGIEPRN
jgi:hypothetical protein